MRAAGDKIPGTVALRARTRLSDARHRRATLLPQAVPSLERGRCDVDVMLRISPRPTDVEPSLEGEDSGRTARGFADRAFVPEVNAVGRGQEVDVVLRIGPGPGEYKLSVVNSQHRARGAGLFESNFIAPVDAVRGGHHVQLQVADPTPGYVQASPERAHADIRGRGVVESDFVIGALASGCRGQGAGQCGQSD